MNAANTALIDNLPPGAPVEVRASRRRARRASVAHGPAAAAVRGAEPVVPERGDLTMHAALNEDPRAIRQAAMLDPNAAATLTVDQIWDLCDALVAAHGDLLPDVGARKAAADPVWPDRSHDGELATVHDDDGAVDE